VTRDTLSDVLRCVRLRGAVFYYITCGGKEWAAAAPAACEVAPAVMPGVEHVMEYHVMTKGNGWAAVAGEQPVRLAAGDIVVFPHGDAHVMSSAPGVRPEGPDREWFFATRNDPKPIPVSYYGAELAPGAPVPEAEANLVCGFLGCDLKPFNPLVATLPRLLHIPGADNEHWVAEVMRQAVRASESRSPGAEAVLERMSEMMFVDAVRRYLERLPDDSRGWLAGLRDRHVGRALALLHGEPARDWSIEGLAREVALSRSAFYDRFVDLVGQPPMQYLTQWRMQLAARLLRESRSPIASIALDVGYDSEAAFSRAFKRLTGTPPATWRRERQA
jgi:AraC-like DNA-binding protein